MADNKSAQSATTWPLPAFHFNVAIGGADALNGSFSEVTGLTSEASSIEYHHGNSATYSTTKMPGLVKVGNVTLKRGVFKSDSSFWTWYNSIAQNTIKRQNIVITLLDEKSNATMTWTLTNTFPTKITGTDPKTNGSEVAVETIEFAFETMNVAPPQTS